ncbi:hypothetical protein HZH66_006390 [Vespula vulgaris]|uniref:DUF4773 domain-containing protein n=1 Tax=Vespula vulgaris TaxID=7454 RepID=A0A834N8Q0_VESVU|nr:hypothetical protein HZH66_006390 [Vespula vulgaris]
MNVRISKTFLLLLCIFSEFNINKKQRFPTSKAFLIFKTNSLSGRSCTCSTSYSCSCCENVIIIYTKMTKQLCVNFIYETNALKVNITLNSIILTDQTITEYKSFRICNKVPGSFFSNVCANVLELNRFPRSITICLRTEIATKHKLWQLNYNCITMPSGQMPAMPAMPSGQMPGTPAMPPGQMMGMPPGQMMGMPPGQMMGMPPGQMMGMPGMAPGQMPPGQTMGMPGMSSG